MSVDVRQLATEDWDVLRGVRLAALRDSPDAFAETADDAATRPPAAWKAWLAEAAAFVATADDEPIGMVSSAHRDAPDDRGLAALWVAPAFRGGTVAGGLVSTFLRWAQHDGGHRVTLWVGPANVAACRRYEALGFVRTGSTRGTTIGPVVEMALVLPVGTHRGD